jgi:hypothetical protein
MKKKLFFALLMLTVMGALFAQVRDQDSRSRQYPRYDREPFREFRQELETSTISGKLEFIDGNIAVKNDGTVYYIKGLGRLIGFVDGLKEGAEVSLEGWAVAGPGTPEYRRFLVSKLTLNGKEYADLFPGPGPMMEPPAIARGDDFGPGGSFRGPHCSGIDRSRDSRRGRWR